MSGVSLDEIDVTLINAGGENQAVRKSFACPRPSTPWLPAKALLSPGFFKDFRGR